MSRMSDFAHKLDDAINRLGLSNEDVGNAIGVSGETIRNWRKKTPKAIVQLEALAGVVKTPAGQLVGDEATSRGSQLDEAAVVLAAAARGLGLTNAEATELLAAAYRRSLSGAKRAAEPPAGVASKGPVDVILWVAGRIGWGALMQRALGPDLKHLADVGVLSTMDLTELAKADEERKRAEGAGVPAKRDRIPGPK